MSASQKCICRAYHLKCFDIDGCGIKKWKQFSSFWSLDSSLFVFSHDTHHLQMWICIVSSNQMVFMSIWTENNDKADRPNRWTLAAEEGDSLSFRRIHVYNGIDIKYFLKHLMLWVPFPFAVSKYNRMGVEDMKNEKMKLNLTINLYSSSKSTFFFFCLSELLCFPIQPTLICSLHSHWPQVIWITLIHACW